MALGQAIAAGARQRGIPVVGLMPVAGNLAFEAVLPLASQVIAASRFRTPPRNDRPRDARDVTAMGH